jgi:Uma2 family endonuclease
MFAMAGGSLNHALLANSLGAILRGKVPAGCRVFSADLRIYIAETKTYTYGDVSVVCGEVKLSSDQQDNVLNPMLIAEVLSPSTEGYDRGKKFELYRTIESFQEYLLIHQDRCRVEHYSRQEDGSWLLREYSGQKAVIGIDRLSVLIPLDDLYTGVKL